MQQSHFKLFPVLGPTLNFALQTVFLNLPQRYCKSDILDTDFCFPIFMVKILPIFGGFVASQNVFA